MYVILTDIKEKLSTIMIDKISAIYGFGITINTFLILLLLSKKGKTTADKILFIWFCFALAHQILNYLEMVDIYKTHFSFLIGVEMPLPLLQAPFLFLYVSQLTDSSFIVRNKNSIVLHFLPAIICYIYMIKFFVMPVDQKLYIMSHNGIGYEQFVALKFIAIICSGLIYITLSLLKIKHHQQKIENVFSNTAKINLQWLKILTYGIGIIWLVVFFGNQVLTFVAISFYISAIGFFGIKQVQIFSNNQIQIEPIPDVDSTVVTTTVKYETAKMSDTKRNLIETRLKQQMDENKLFLNSDLTLDTLAIAIDVHSNDVSQYINSNLGLTFYDYINIKRIEEFKRKVNLPESRNLNLLGIAFDCGFNSKSTFNRNFKKITGQTPSEYLSNLNATSST